VNDDPSPTRPATLSRPAPSPTRADTCAHTVTAPPVRVLLVDDEPLLRMAFTMVLDAQSDMVPVGEAGDGAQAVRQARALRPDVVLMDVRMPGMDGIEATARIVEGCPESKVLILTTFDLDAYAFAGLKAGASGFLLKNALPEELLGAIRAVAAGDAVVAPRVTRRLLEHFAHQLPSAGGDGGGAGDSKLARLTAREREVLVEVGRGLSNTEIAATLHLAEATVKTHLSRVLVKLELRDRVQAVVFAYETRLVRPS
jgi:DNA-binding NarL/FixJ family response regulator